jgi:hypothetical protein
MAKKAATKNKTAKTGAAKRVAAVKPAAPAAKPASKYAQVGAPWWKQHLPGG